MPKSTKDKGEINDNRSVLSSYQTFSSAKLSEKNLMKLAAGLCIYCDCRPCQVYEIERSECGEIVSKKHAFTQDCIDDIRRHGTIISISCVIEEYVSDQEIGNQSEQISEYYSKLNELCRKLSAHIPDNECTIYTGYDTSRIIMESFVRSVEGSNLLPFQQNAIFGRQWLCNVLNNISSGIEEHIINNSANSISRDIWLLEKLDPIWSNLTKTPLRRSQKAFNPKCRNAFSPIEFVSCVLSFVEPCSLGEAGRILTRYGKVKKNRLRALGPENG